MLFQLLVFTQNQADKKPTEVIAINFPQDIQELANILPRYPKELPIIVITVTGKDNNYKDLIVRKEKISMALHWLVEHNPVYKDIEIDYNCLSSLPTEGIPGDLQKICCGETSENEIDPDRRPLDVVNYHSVIKQS